MDNQKDNISEKNNSLTAGLSRKQSYQKKKSKPRRRLLIAVLFLMVISSIIFGLYYQGYFFQVEKKTVVQETNSNISETKSVSFGNNNNSKVNNDKSINKVEKIISTRNPNYELAIIKKQEVTPLEKADSGEIILLGENDLTLKGVNDQKEFFFTLPPSKMGDRSYIELSISSSQLLNQQFSSFTVYLNNEPLKSVKLDKVYEFATVRIPMTNRVLTEGLNKLSIQSHTFINKDICLDQNDPANWIIIHNTSYVFIDKREVIINKDLLKNFPYPFVTNGGQEEVFTTIVIPNNSNGFLIKEAIKLSQYLSSQTQKKQAVPVQFEEEWETSDTGNHIIAIGPLHSWKGKLAKILSNTDISLQDSELYLQNIIEESKSKKRQLLFVTANKTDTIIDKGYILTTPNLTKQLTGNAVKIAKSPKVEQKNLDKDQTKLKLFDRPVVLDETKLKSERFFIQIPSYWTIKDQGTLNLKFKASLLLDQWSDKKSRDKLGLTAYINELPFTIPLATLFDEGETEQLLEYKIPVPKELLVNNKFLSIDFEFNYPGAVEGCIQNNKGGNWIILNKDSALSVPYMIEKNKSFKKWPSALMGENGYEKMAFILPKSIPTNGLNQLSMLVNQLSAYQTNFDDFIIVRSSIENITDDILADYNIVDFGELKNRLKEDQQLIIPRLENQAFDLSEYGFINETAKYISWMQPSFWNEDKTIVFFQALEEDKSSPFFQKDFFRNLEKVEQKGEPIIIVLNKANESFVYDETRRKNSIKQEKSKFSNSSKLYFLVFGIIFLLCLIVFFNILRKRGSRFS